MVYIKKYDSFKKYGIFSTNDKTLSFETKEDISDFFADANNKGWYTRKNNCTIIFYRMNGQAYFYDSKNNRSMLIDDSIRFFWSSCSYLPIIKTFKVFKKDELVFKINYIGKPRLFSKIDFTMAQEHYDLDLLALIYFVCSNRNRLEEFKNTGFYTS